MYVNNLVLILILAWIVFWIGRCIFVFNDEKFIYRKGKYCYKDKNPILFYSELVVSMFWVMAGLFVLILFLYSMI